ncbi:MAG: tRNA threonylcarbamoyladenosine dehydratase [Bacteroidales bacterium]|nr:tRNA threonylcarbamoyladenosine dehydratase [Candidatus Cryptobacteroides equifaecalis]
MAGWQERTRMLLGDEGLARLSSARVLVVGVGGVGGYACEMLVRSGVGRLTIVDSDEVGESNINRQLLALHSTVGRPKVEVLRDRLMDINPELDLRIVPEYINEENVAQLFLDAEGNDIHYDAVVDAIDTLSPKISLIQFCLAHGLRLVSSMGSGAKMDATAVRIADISKTYQCPLAHMLRKRLHKLGISKGFLAVFSAELPHKESLTLEESRNKKSQVGTISYMPAVFGCVCAQAAIQSILD